MVASFFKRIICTAIVGLTMVECIYSQDYTDATGNIMRHALDVHNFNREFQQEKVYLHLDNTSYFQGETIWFKAFVVDASTLRRSSSSLLYVELLSPTGVLLQQQKLKIYAGQADGCIRLVDSSVREAQKLRGEQPYPSGYYELRAYTRYMLNFSHNIVFSRVIPVFRTPQIAGKYDEAVLESTKYESYDARQETEKLKSVNVSYFPEGGRLLLRRPGRVAYKATDENGRPIDGVLYVKGRSDGQTIKAPVVHDGMGRFEVLSGKSISKCVFVHEGKEYKVPNPYVEDQGVSMRVDAKSDSLSITVYNGMGYEGLIGLAVSCSGQIISCDSYMLAMDSIRLSLPAKNIPIGVCDITVFEKFGNVRATRHFFNYREDYAPPVLTATPDRQSYGPYDPVCVSLSLKDGNGQPFRDRFCIAVRDAANIETMYKDDLTTFLLLSSDLKGLIQDPQYYFEKSDEEHREAMDLLCMVQGWER